MKSLLIAAAMILCLCTGAHAQAKPDNKPPIPATDETELKKVEIKKLLELTGAAKLGDQLFVRLFELMKETVREVPDTVWQELEKEFRDEISSGRLAERMSPVYEAHFTAAELKELVSFYESPIGRKVINELPQVMQEAMTVGQQMGLELTKKVYERLKKKGYSVPVT